jgi:hypothetical protein
MFVAVQQQAIALDGGWGGGRNFGAEGQIVNGVVDTGDKSRIKRVPEPPAMRLTAACLMRSDRLLLGRIKVVGGSLTALFAAIRTNFYKGFPEIKSFLLSGQQRLFYDQPLLANPRKLAHRQKKSRGAPLLAAAVLDC